MRDKFLKFFDRFFPQDSKKISASTHSISTNLVFRICEVYNFIQNVEQDLPITSAQDQVAGKTVKPVFVQSDFQAIRTVMQSIQFFTEPLLKGRGSNSTQVLCFSVSDKTLDPVDKPNYFLLKGFFQAPCKEVLSLLQASAVPVNKVTDIIHNINYVMYLVHFDKSVNINLLNHSHKYVDGIVVKWDALKKAQQESDSMFSMPAVESFSNQFWINS
ncbi:hypothetical protein ACKWTF_007587 [Chironomus riparius]